MKPLPSLAPLALCLLLQTQAPLAATAPPVPDFQALSADELQQRAMQRRAVEAVNWGMSAVNFDRMLQALIHTAKGQPNQIVYWSQPLTGNNQTLTPNPDVIYLMPFFDTREVGPLVLEIPPADDGVLVATLTDTWQAALEEVGPIGADQGKGGKYLILPPDYQGEIPPGYLPVHSETWQGFVLLRSMLSGTDPAAIAKAVAYGKRVRLYPLAEADKPPATTFIDAKDMVFDSTIPYDLRFFESLDRVVQTEPWLTRDRVMIDMLRSIGIEKGKPFKPDARQRAALTAGIAEAKAWMDARLDTTLLPYYPDGHWFYPAPLEMAQTVASHFQKPDAYAVDGRGLFYSYAFSSTKHPGKGLLYLMARHDADAKPLDGSRSYRLEIPAKIPVRQYWGATLYDQATHALIRGAARPGRFSLSEGLQTNADGSVTLYLSPKAPAGHESNWIPTNPGGRFEVLFRFYGPEQALRDKTWRLPDIQAVPN